jgi:glycosyltransferase involved in cell wall biosynthesis
MANNPKVSVVVTILNEEQSVIDLLDGLFKQTFQPSEIIITDAGSSDSTVQLIKTWQKKYPKRSVKLLIKKGNRSIGRNWAIKHAVHGLIAITDAGCIPHDNWLYQLVHTQQKTQADVVAGFYDALPKTHLEMAIVPYMLVMPDKINTSEFLPATRSMLLKKEVWVKLQGFNERLTVSEDYEFAKRIKQGGYAIAFTHKAKVSWLPMSTLGSFFTTVQSMATYDVMAGVMRAKALFVLTRYFILLSVVLYLLSVGLINMLALLLGCAIVIYGAWSIQKNVRYVGRAWYWLPILQVIADLAVMLGTVQGLTLRK